MIPNTIHFCFGFHETGDFGFLEYLAVKSAVTLNRPDATIVHCDRLPTGPWWERARALVAVNRMKAPTTIFGRPLRHYAHQADVVRLQVLLEHGGIYLDIDTLCIRPFTALLANRCVMGLQRARGLCNAVIVSEPQGLFISTWLDSYRSFRSRGRDVYWDEHSVQLPWRLASQERLRSAITILNDRAFFFPLWGEMQYLFAAEDTSVFDESFSIHYWETLTRAKWLENVRPEDAATGTSAFWTFARRVL